jgi:hypothetical protein
VKKGFNNEACANWNKAEEVLRDEEVDGDVLTILDTCFASNHTKSGREDVRTFELLSACAIDETTAAPGPQSFTRALIDAMKELLKENNGAAFSTFQLNQRICLNPARRDTPSHLWNRLHHHERHIPLAPLKPEPDALTRRPSLRRPPRGYLTLRFALRDDSLNREQIEYLTRKLSTAFRNPKLSLVGLRRIDWLGLKPARSFQFKHTALAVYACSQWKKFLHKKRQDRQREVDSQENTQNTQNTQTTQTTQTMTSPTRKRSRGDSLDYPMAKRGHMAIPEMSVYRPEHRV